MAYHRVLAALMILVPMMSTARPRLHANLSQLEWWEVLFAIAAFAVAVWAVSTPVRLFGRWLIERGIAEGKDWKVSQGKSVMQNAFNITFLLFLLFVVLPGVYLF